MTPGLITLVYNKPKIAIPRHYLRGFVGSSGMTDLEIHDHYLAWVYLGFITYVFPIRSNFYTPNTNVYTLDYIFDQYNCEVFIGTSPVAGSVYINFLAMPNKAEWRVQVLASLPIDTAIYVDLPPVTAAF